MWRGACRTALLGFPRPCEDSASTPESCFLPLVSARTETSFHHENWLTWMQDASWACPAPHMGVPWPGGVGLVLIDSVERPRVSSVAFLRVRPRKPSSWVGGSECSGSLCVLREGCPPPRPSGRRAPAAGVPLPERGAAATLHTLFIPSDPRPDARGRSGANSQWFIVTGTGIAC